MAWNEPGSNGNDNDPWGGGRRGGDQGPPDIDQVIKNLTKKFNGLFGGSRGGGSNTGGGSSSPRRGVTRCAHGRSVACVTIHNCGLDPQGMDGPGRALVPGPELPA